jgi:hypothetical protein
MEKYRIKEIECYGGRKVYEVQKRLFGYLWWYNFLNSDAWETGIFSTQKEAEVAIECDMWKPKTRIVKTY